MTFKKGESGNIAGRPKGITNYYRISRETLAVHKDELLGNAIEMAKNGSEPMMKMLLDRMLPAKPKDDPILTNIKASEDIREQSIAILKKIHEGEITPTEGYTVMQSISTHDTIINNSEVVKMALEVAGKSV